VSPVRPSDAKARIAFVDLWRLGDAVAATAGLAALRRACPAAELAIVAHPLHGDPLFRLLPDVVHVPFAAFWTRGKAARDKYLPWTIDYRALVTAWRRLRAFAPTVCLLFRADVREQLFFSSLGTARIVDFGNGLTLPWVRAVARPSKVPRFREYVHLVNAWAQADVNAEPSIRGCASGPPVRDRSYVVVHPGASWRFKQWSEEKLAAIIRDLGLAGVPVILVGGEVDRAIIDRITRMLSGPVEVVFPSVKGLYELVAGARLVICNNSAPLHIAEALGTPCVAITGPNDPVRWGTYRPHSRTIERSVGLPCHPCLEKRCVRPADPCIERVQVADVWRAVSELGVAHASHTTQGATHANGN